MDRQVSQLWTKRALYLFLAFLIMFLHLLPLDTQPGRLPFPDLLMALTFAWVLRRPEYVPIPLIAIVMLLADLLLQRPPGLLAALVVLGSAYLRGAAPGMRDDGFFAEWTTAAVAITAVFVLNRIILAILTVQQTALGPMVIQVVLTIAVYPLIVLLSQSGFGVRRASAVDSAAAGLRS
ncbi:MULTISPECIES: rod shape-determining protein MreD [unclassified Ruegeria]|uniref:rod shape-determining protein MreD n=1 Tax=unclassified Ruegeria TaxID=2625375 RepID=UPI001489B315|nr:MULTISPECIES: rod shape-determining protein MreD [unclassified Ruegeria]